MASSFLRTSDFRLRIFACPYLVAFICLLLIPEFAAGQNRLTLDRYLQSERFSSPRISPDGSKVVYSRQSIDKLADRWGSGLWMMEIDGSGNRFFRAVRRPDGLQMEHEWPTWIRRKTTGRTFSFIP